MARGTHQIIRLQGGRDTYDRDDERADAMNLRYAREEERRAAAEERRQQAEFKREQADRKYGLAREKMDLARTYAEARAVRDDEKHQWAREVHEAKMRKINMLLDAQQQQFDQQNELRGIQQAAGMGRIADLAIAAYHSPVVETKDAKGGKVYRRTASPEIVSQIIGDDPSFAGISEVQVLDRGDGDKNNFALTFIDREGNRNFIDADKLRNAIASKYGDADFADRTVFGMGTKQRQQMQLQTARAKDQLNLRTMSDMRNAIKSIYNDGFKNGNTEEEIDEAVDRIFSIYGGGGVGSQQQGESARRLIDRRSAITGRREIEPQQAGDENEAYLSSFGVGRGQQQQQPQQQGGHRIIRTVNDPRFQRLQTLRQTLEERRKKAAQ